MGLLGCLPTEAAAIREQTGGKLPDYLHKAVKASLACGQLANGFSRCVAGASFRR